MVKEVASLHYSWIYLLLNIVQALGFCRCSLVSWRNSLCSQFLRDFINSMCWIWSNVFLPSFYMAMIMWLSFFTLPIWWITLINYWTMNQSCIHKVNLFGCSTLIFLYCWILLAIFCSGVLHQCSMRGTGV